MDPEGPKTHLPNFLDPRIREEKLVRFASKYSRFNPLSESLKDPKGDIIC
jgi:hypothetical protein